MKEKILRYITPVEDPHCRSTEARSNTTEPALKILRKRDPSPEEKKFALRLRTERLIRGSNPPRPNAPWTVPSS